MKEKIKSLYRKHESIILYSLYGIPTTAIGFGGYALLMDFFHFNPVLSSFLSWIAAVFASFFLYRRFVFKIPPTSFLRTLRELIKFIGLRIGTGLFETGFVWLFVSHWHLQPYLFKILASGLSILINFMVSKFYIFCHNEHIAE